MPLVPSTYSPPFLFKNGHFSTVYAGVLRKVDGVQQERERIELEDGDFLDVDWSYANTKTPKVAIIIHGLEGNAQRAYVTGSAKILNADGFDACALNLRSCSGESNRLYRSYHSGVTDDVDAVLNHILSTKNYSEIYLNGFSLGGNLILKYLGERSAIAPEVKAAVAISTPCDLYSSLQQLLQFKNAAYSNRFKKHLKDKLKEKQELFPEAISNSEIKAIKTLRDFDEIHTSKANGFKDALDYYQKCSSLQFLPNIKTPTLIVNALNDSFLGESCYPVTISQNNSNLYLEMPKFGGHVGFYGPNNVTYTEKRTLNFMKEVL